MSKHLLVFTLVVALAVVLVGCGDESGTALGGSTAIKKTIEGFYSAYNAENWNTCLNYVADTNNVGASMMKSMLQTARTATGKVTVESVTNISITGSTATADVKITYGGQSESKEYPLVKKDGSWKIAWQ